VSDELTNISFDGSPVRIRLKSPLVALFDPLALDLIRELTQPETPFSVVEFLSRANSRYSAIACFEIADFRPGFYSLDPRDIKKFSDEDDDFDYESRELPETNAPDTVSSFPFAAVDSGALVIADIAYIAVLAGVMTWEEYDRGLEDESVFGSITNKLGGPYFALIQGGCDLGIDFDGDGTYTIPRGALKPADNDK
jgi:hypothetical protein